MTVCHGPFIKLLSPENGIGCICPETGDEILIDSLAHQQILPECSS